MKNICAALLLAYVAVFASVVPSFGSNLAISPVSTAVYITDSCRVASDGKKIRLCVTVEKTAISSKQPDSISLENIPAMHRATIAAWKHVVHHAGVHLHAVHVMVRDAGAHLGSHMTALHHHATTHIAAHLAAIGHHARGLVASCVYTAQHHRVVTAIAEHARQYSDSAGSSFKNVCMDQISKVTVLLTPPSA